MSIENKTQTTQPVDSEEKSNSELVTLKIPKGVRWALKKAAVSEDVGLSQYAESIIYAGLVAHKKGAGLHRKVGSVPDFESQYRKGVSDSEQTNDSAHAEVISDTLSGLSLDDWQVLEDVAAILREGNGAIRNIIRGGVDAWKEARLVNPGLRSVGETAPVVAKERRK